MAVPPSSPLVPLTPVGPAVSVGPGAHGPPPGSITIPVTITFVTEEEHHKFTNLTPRKELENFIRAHTAERWQWRAEDGSNRVAEGACIGGYAWAAGVELHAVVVVDPVEYHNLVVPLDTVRQAWVVWTLTPVCNAYTPVMVVKWRDLHKTAVSRGRGVDTARYPHTCPSCGAAAYVGFLDTDCSAGCTGRGR